MEVRDPDTYCGLIVFERDDDKYWETLNEEEEETRDGNIESSLCYEDEELKGYGANNDGALTIHKEQRSHDGGLEIRST